MALTALPPSPPLPAHLLDQLATIVGPAGLITEPAKLAPFTSEQRGNYQGATPAVVRPATTAEVSAVVRLCAALNVPMVPQGGNTGLTGATVTNGEIVLNLGRMDHVRDLDPSNFTVTVEAGCILANIQQAADTADRLFPLSLGAEGTCQIGGNLSTNAGGTAVLRYGNARDLVLGLEVVLADGQIWNGLRTLRKDNTGYDLKHLFIGAEGTLGVITAATLKLFPRPRIRETALAATPDVAAAIDLLALARTTCGDTITAFEYLSRIALESALEHGPNCRNPLSQAYDCNLLIEVGGQTAGALERLLEEGHDRGLVLDAAVASSETQRDALWRIREATTTSQRPLGASIKNDVSVPISQVPVFLDRAAAALQRACPGIRPYPFGHLGDGNIHYNLTQPPDADPQAYLARWEELTGVVNAVVSDLNGSISAEHGIGLIKREVLPSVKSPVELTLMHDLKRTLDPKNLMNPAKMLSMDPTQS